MRCGAPSNFVSFYAGSFKTRLARAILDAHNFMTSVASAVAFLRWLFGDEPSGYIYVYAEHAKKDGRKFFHHKVPDDIDNDWWSDFAAQHRITYCVQTLRSKKYHKDNPELNLNSGGNIRATPALWFDIDGCKKIVRDGEPVVSGHEFFNDYLKLQYPEVSAWVRSSQHGIHGFFKLKEPVEIEGDKERFDKRIQPILLDIAWHLGADVDVATIGRLMRLPGSLNLKREYQDKPFEATYSTNDDAPEHTLKSLRERFTPDFDAVPRLVLYTITKLIHEVWGEGERHNVMLALAGSVRKAGLDKASCKRLFADLKQELVDDESRDKELETTYNKDFDTPLVTLHGEYRAIAEAVDAALAFWFDLKTKYAKKRNIDWHPEIDPTQRKDDDKPFYVHDGQTWYKNDKGVSAVLANFSVRILKKIVKADDGSVVWLADVSKKGTPSITIQIPAALQVSAAKFMTIKPMISGLVFEPAGLWGQYTKFLDEVYADAPIVQETYYYGVLGLEDSTPTILLPDDASDTYLWPDDRKRFDTALPGAFRKDVGTADAKSYLEKFGRYYPLYQDPSYLYPALGWVCASLFTAFMRYDHRFEGFPTMVVTGLKGSGKSTLMTQVLGPHFGCGEAMSYAQGTTTPHAIKRRLASNNICPYILDEFRDEVDQRTTALQGIIRTLWSGDKAESGMADGMLRSEHLLAPLCVIGEQPMGDEATLDRIFSVRVSPSWVKRVRSLSAGEKAEFLEAQAWLHKHTHTGWLGTLLLRYITQHMDEVDSILSAALSFVEETCVTPNERKRKGFAAIFAGLILLSKVYQEYDVPFFLKKRGMIEAVYSADPEVLTQQALETNTLKTLFIATDKAIIDGMRKHTSHESYMYTFDPTRDDVIYFQRTRWLEEISGLLKGSASAALKNDRGFFDLLKESAAEADPIILSVDHDTPFRGAVAVDTAKIAARFHIDVERWKRPNEDFD